MIMNIRSTIPSILERPIPCRKLSMKMSLPITRMATAASSERGDFIHVVFDLTARGITKGDSEDSHDVHDIAAEHVPEHDPGVPDSEAKKLTMNSAWDVPNATIVRPMTMFGMLYRFASDDAPSTSMSAP